MTPDIPDLSQYHHFQSNPLLQDPHHLYENGLAAQLEPGNYNATDMPNYDPGNPEDSILKKYKLACGPATITGILRLFFDDDIQISDIYEKYYNAYYGDLQYLPESIRNDAIGQDQSAYLQGNELFLFDGMMPTSVHGILNEEVQNRNIEENKTLNVTSIYNADEPYEEYTDMISQPLKSYDVFANTLEQGGVVVLQARTNWNLPQDAGTHIYYLTDVVDLDRDGHITKNDAWLIVDPFGDQGEAYYTEAETSLYKYSPETHNQGTVGYIVDPYSRLYGNIYGAIGVVPQNQEIPAREPNNIPEPNFFKPWWKKYVNGLQKGVEQKQQT